MHLPSLLVIIRTGMAPCLLFLALPTTFTHWSHGALFPILAVEFEL